MGGTSSGGQTINVTATPGQLTIKKWAFSDDGSPVVNKTNRLVDVFSGGSNPIYRFWATINDTSGWSEVEWVEFRAWYKNGNAAAAFNSTPGANYNFYFNYTNTTDTSTGGNFAKKWPAANEVVFVGGTDEVIDAQTHNLSVRFRLGNQVHNASATGAWSWAFSIFVHDKNGNEHTRTGDFGVYRYVSLTTSGSPSGSATPGSTATLAPDHTLTFSTNSDFYLEVTATDLTQTKNSQTYTIGKDKIRVNTAAGTNGTPDLTTEKNFAATDATIDIYGAFNDNSSASAHPAYASGTFEVAVVRIRVDVPLGTPSGTYSGSLTYRLWQRSSARP